MKKYRQFWCIRADKLVCCSHGKGRSKRHKICYLFEMIGKNLDMRCTVCNNTFDGTSYYNKNEYIEIERVVFKI